MSQFHSYRWIGTRPEHLDVEGAQLLLIGEKSSFDEVMEQSVGDSEELVDKMEELEEEIQETLRLVRGGDESAALFKELEVRARDYPKLQTKF